MNKFKKISTQLFFVISLFAAPFLVTNAFSQSGYYTSAGCTDCHLSSPTTCNGCHGHGTHPSSAKSSINVAGVTNKTSYAPGETVSVSLTGGYKSGWVRVVLYDQNSVEVARSSGNDSGQGSSATYPATLSAPAPSTPGTYTWKAGWYGNVYDKSGATFGAGWTPDATNPDHGYELVSTNSFTVAAVAAAPTITSVTPSTLAQGAVNQTVAIAGTNLTGGTVTFSNAGVTHGAATITATSITLPVSVTAGAILGVGTVTVTTAGGNISNAFTVSATASPAPKISSVTPSTLAQGAATQTVIITGTNLIGGTVSFSNTGVTGGAATITDTFITLPISVTSNATSGAGTVTVTTATGTTSSAFTVNPPAQAKIDTTGYTTLSSAYSNAATSGTTTILLMDISMAGPLTIDKNIVLDGGYDALFNAKTGQPTMISGALTITTGSLTVADVAVM